MITLNRYFGLCLTGFITAPLLAQGMPSSAVLSPPAQQSQEIIVRGQVKDVFRRFVESATQFGPTDQVARWKQEICPTVEGIDPTQAEFMADRIGQVAETVGLRRGGGCVATMAVVVAPDADQFVDDLVRAYPVTLRTDGVGRLKSFATSTSPVRWISVTNACSEACVLPNSRLTKSTKPTFHAMIVVVDARKIAGISLGELSDYVSLVALSNPPLKSPNSAKSILSMFERQRTQEQAFGLTDYDISFLNGLYRSSIDRSGKEQRSSIARRMAKELGEEQVKPEAGSQAP